MPANRPLIMAIALTATVAAAATSHAAPPEPPPSFSFAMERLADVDKSPQDVTHGVAAAASPTMQQRRHGGVPTVAERERPDRTGRNDTLERAQRIRHFGTARRDAQDVRLAGTLVELNAPPTPVGHVAEDDGAIPLASATGLTAEQSHVRASAVIGDGPHGTIEGDGSGDFDFYRIDDAAAGELLTVDIDAVALGADLDAVVAVLAPTGQILAFNDDSPELDSFVQVELPADGDYFVAVAAFGSLPTNPFESGSGTGARTEGAYDITMSFEFAEDVDVYRFDMRPGDVLGAALQGSGRVVELFDPSGTLVMGSGRDGGVGIYPEQSPLNVRGNATLDHVAAVDGPHFLRVSRGAGAYEVDLRLRRPGIEADAPGSRQIIFLDFDGAFIDDGTFDRPGGDLSPLADFLAGWGLGPADEAALIDAVVARFTENVVDDPGARGGNTRFDVEVRNSKDHADPWGQPNVSRIVIGGTREQLGINTVGLSPTVDPGNFAREETAVVLLDQASAPAGSGQRTINEFVTPDTDVIALVGSVLGFVASHEAGHYLGDWHTQPNNGVVSIMDTFDLTQLGLGPDFVFGTADDVDVDFVVDQLIEGHIGVADTMARVASALSSPETPRASFG